MLNLNSLAIGAASLFAVVVANHAQDLHARAHHHGVVERSEHMNAHQKRFNGQATYYQTGLGACGIYNNPSDKIVALNSAQFGGGYPGPNCFKMITICKGSNCHPAQITDECPTCDYGSLDLSQSLFQEFANTDDGVFPMTWTFNDASSDDPPKTTSTKKVDPPKTTKQPETTWEPEPTTTWEPPSTTSTKKRTTTSSPPPETTSTPEPTTSTTSSTPEPTSTSEAKSSTSSTPTAISSVAPSTAVDTSAAPTATGSSGTGSSSSSSDGGSNLGDANQIMLAMGRMAVVANGGQ